METQHKIKSLEKLMILREELRSNHKKVVTINGSFDIMHVGHVYMLEQAKSQGDVLIVGLNSDSSIKQYKSEDRPINSQNNRARFMASLECVDHVFIFNETNPIPFLESLKPDIHCNGSEYGKECIEAETVTDNGGEIYVIKLLEGFSTSTMLQKMLEVSTIEKQQKKSHNS